jgi:hypothetical protein
MTKKQDGGRQSSPPQEIAVDNAVEPSTEVTPNERILIPERIARNSRR